MQFEDFSAYFNSGSDVRNFILKYDFEKLAHTWEDIPPTLSEKFILEQLDKLRSPLDNEAVLRAAEELKSNRYLLSCYNFLCYYWWEHPDCQTYGHFLPEYGMNPAGRENEGIFYLLTALASFPVIERKYLSMGIPQKYALDTVQYTLGALDEYAAGHDGKLGLAARKMHWYSFYIKGQLFRIGRFEYMLQDPLEYLPVAYKRKSDGKVIAFCRHGWQLSADGYRLFQSDSSTSTYLTTQVECDGKTFTGTPINPSGFAEVDRKISIRLDEYIPLWNNWDLVPGLHIPGGGNMTPQAALQSLEMALDFFPRYFNRRVAAICCFSWIFNNDLEHELPESNLARFMQQLYLFPFASSGLDGLEFVFGKSSKDWSRYPADTSLQRAFHRIRQKGKRLKCGGMFIDENGIRNFGSKLYRKNYSSFSDL